MRKLMVQLMVLCCIVLLPLCTSNIKAQNLTFNLQSKRSKIAVVPGGLIIFRLSLNNLSTSSVTFVLDSKLVNQSQFFPYRVLYQNQPVGKTITVNSLSAKEVTVEVTTTQTTPIGAKGAIQIVVKAEGSSDVTKQEALLSFIITKQVTMILKQNSSTVQLSDQDPVTLDAAPYIQGGRTFVPLRFVGESFGARVEWVAKEKKITYHLRGLEIVLWINQTKFISGGTEKEMDTPAELRPPGRTFVPLRIISEELGAKVEWNELTRQIKIVFTIS